MLKTKGSNNFRASPPVRMRTIELQATLRMDLVSSLVQRGLCFSSKSSINSQTPAFAMINFASSVKTEMVGYVNLNDFSGSHIFVPSSA